MSRIVVNEMNIKSVPEIADDDRIHGGKTRSSNYSLLYGLDDEPKLFMSILLGLQHYITMLGGTVTYPYILTTKLCMRDTDPAKGAVIATTLFCSGVATYIQTTFGVRLPVVQGATFTFLVPTLAILSLPQWQCPNDEAIINSRNHSVSFQGHEVTDDEYTEVWQLRMREISGAILASSFVEIILGSTGLIGFLMRFITPLSIVPTITLIGLSLFKEATAPASESWIISGLTIIMVILFSQYLIGVHIPVPIYSVADKKFTTKKLPVIKMFPVLITISISWTLCYILTVSDLFPERHAARTDGVLSRLISRSPWIRVPYPFQFGFPTFSSSAVLGMTAGVIASALESVGDYYAAANICSNESDHSTTASTSASKRANKNNIEVNESIKDVSNIYPPPNHAINRGIFMEGVGCLLSGLMGSGGGLTSYSENIGALGITKVASRHVVQVAAIMMIILSLFVKVSNVLATIPVPIIGGILMTMFGICSGVGLSSLQYIDLNSSRNLSILGTSLFLGLSIPKWILEHPDSIKTGSDTLDQVLFVLLSTGMLVGGAIGCFLDNTIPGNNDERGIIKWRMAGGGGGGHEDGQGDGEELRKNERCTSYDLPPLINDWIVKTKFMKYIPMSPTFEGSKVSNIFSSVRKRMAMNRTENDGEQKRTDSIKVNSVHLNIN